MNPLRAAYVHPHLARPSLADRRKTGVPDMELDDDLPTLDATQLLEVLHSMKA